MLSKIKTMIDNSKKYEWEGDFKALIHHLNQEIEYDSNWEVFEKLETVSRNLELKQLIYKILDLDSRDFVNVNLNLSSLVDLNQEKMVDKMEYMMMIYFMIYKSLKNGDLRL